MNLNLIAKVLIICLGLLEAVSSTPQLHKASDGQEYLIDLDQKFNNIQAWHECARRGYQLVEIDSDKKNTGIIEILKKVNRGFANLWISGNDEFSSSKDYKRIFVWSATGRQLNFTNWASHNPDNYRRQEHCAHIWSKSSDYKWNDVDCDNGMGFICEVNHFKKSYNNYLKQKCDVVKTITSSISHEHDQAHKQQLSEIDSKIQNVKSQGDDLRALIQQLQTTSQMAIKNILDEQQKTVKRLFEDMQQQVNELNVEIKRSTAAISAQFGEKLSEKQDEILTIC